MLQVIKNSVAQHLLTPGTTTIQCILITIGLFVALKFLLRELLCTARWLFTQKRDLLQRYGENSYVVVTGSTGGIGKALAIAFAKRGFNIISISRNPKKLEKTEKEILQANPKINVQSIQTDFSKASDLSIFEDIHSKIERLDISILINNVGIDSLLQFKDSSPQFLKDMIFINVLSTVIMTRTLLPKLRNRKKMSGVINISSSAGSVPASYFTTYCGTKAFMDMLGASLRKENRGLVDFMTVKPFEVSTDMTGNKGADLRTITAEQCANAVLEDFTRGVHRTAGHWNHKLQSWMVETLPEWFFDLVWENHMAEQFYKDRGIKGYKPLGQ